MAGDWIKMRTDLYRDPKVCLIAEALLDPSGDLSKFVSQHLQCDMAVTRNVMRNVTVGALVTVWGIMRLRGKRVGVDLVCSKATVAILDDIAELPGFGQAMASVGWVAETDEGVVFPRFFDDYNVDPTDKKASSSAERQRRYRERVKANSDVTSDVTRYVTVTHREEKRREELRAVVGSTSTSAEISQGDDDNGAREPPLPGQISDDDAKTAVTAAIALRKVGVRIQPQDPTLLALVAERFTADELVLAAAEKALKDAGWWNDPDMHPELHELLASGATQAQMGLTIEQCTAIKGAAVQVPIRYIASTLRGRRREAEHDTGNNHGSTRRTAGGGGAGGRRSAVDQVQFEIDQRQRATGAVVAHGAG